MKVYLLEWEPSQWKEEHQDRLPHIEIVKIPAPSPTSGLVRFYLSNLLDPKDPTKEDLNEAVIVATHFLALRQFLATDDKEALICDQYITLKKGFLSSLKKIRSNLPSNYSLLSFAYIVESWEGSRWEGKRKEEENLCRFLPSSDGSYGYLINREWAINALTLFDRPWNRLLPQDRSIEALFENSGGYLSIPLLASIAVKEE